MDADELLRRYGAREREFSGSDFPSAELAAACLREVALCGANLLGADLTGTDLRATAGGPVHCLRLAALLVARLLRGAGVPSALELLLYAGELAGGGVRPANAPLFLTGATDRAGAVRLIPRGWASILDRVAHSAV